MEYTVATLVWFSFNLYFTYCDIIFAAFMPPQSLENLEEVAKTIPIDSQGKFIYYQILFCCKCNAQKFFLLLLCCTASAPPLPVELSDSAPPQKYDVFKTLPRKGEGKCIVCIV